MAKCRVCGAPHRACGPKSMVIPVDQRTTTIQGGSMELKEYEVLTDGRRPRKTTMLLNEADAKRFGVFGNEATRQTPATKGAKVPANKARKAPANKQPETPANDPPQVQASTTPEVPAAE